MYLSEIFLLARGKNHLKLTEKAIIYEKAYLYSQNELFEVETNYHKKV